ncbi:MAG: hypothetical protein ACJAVF_004861 [Paraglaciecola sp.]|jgi:hypothetical protein
MKRKNPEEIEYNSHSILSGLGLFDMSYKSI